MIDFKQQKEIIRELNKVIKYETIFSWGIDVPIPVSKKRHEGKRDEIFKMKSKISVFLEATSFS